VTWPDLVIAAIVLLFALKGWKRGFVAEIGGFIALAAALWAAFIYPGTLDPYVRDILHLGEGSAHVVGMAMFAIAVYIVLMLVSATLSRVARLPVIGLGNALGGAAIGVVKAVLGLWVVLYVALFFPLSPDLRGDLHASRLVAYITQDNGRVDALVKGTLPWFVRPFAQPFFNRHRV
jgi:uncharacterized membrane protein required for colicin V production